MIKGNFKLSILSILSLDDKQQIMDLWNTEYPIKLAYPNLTAFEHYLNGLIAPTHILVLSEGKILGWASKFYRDDIRWFAIILSSSIQGQRIGSYLLERIKEDESSLNGWVIDHENDSKSDGTPYKSPLRFYQKQGFEINKELRLELPTLSAVQIVWQKND